MLTEICRCPKCLNLVLKHEEALEIWPDKVLCPNFPASLSEENEKNILEYLQMRKQEFNNKPFMIQISEDIPIDSYLGLLPVLSKLE